MKNFKIGFRKIVVNGVEKKEPFVTIADQKYTVERLKFYMNLASQNLKSSCEMMAAFPCASAAAEIERLTNEISIFSAVLLEITNLNK